MCAHHFQYFLSLYLFSKCIRLFLKLMSMAYDQSVRGHIALEVPKGAATPFHQKIHSHNNVTRRAPPCRPSTHQALISATPHHVSSETCTVTRPRRLLGEGLRERWLPQHPDLQTATSCLRSTAGATFACSLKLQFRSP